jgi:hypothetical protein
MMKRKRITSKDFTQQERNKWKNLEVNLDSFSNRWEERYQDDFKKELDKLSAEFLKDVLNYFSILHSDNDNIRVKLLENRRASLLLYCVIDFALRHPKNICEIFSIKYKKKIDTSIVIEHIFTQYKSDRLTDLFVFILHRRMGKGRFQYSFLEDIKKSDYDRIVHFVPHLATFLKHREKEHKQYHYRFAYKSKLGHWIFLLLKETNDKVHIAIPNNISMVKGVYKLITVKPEDKIIEINTTSKDEAQTIRNYFNKKLKNPYTFRRNEKSYEPKEFFKKVLAPPGDSDALKLVGVDFKDSNIGAGINVKNRELKNDIIEGLKVLQNNKILKLKDFSDFASMNFKYKGLIVPIQVNETAWGVHRLNLVDRRISQVDVASFRKDFQAKFGLELDKWLRRSDEQLNKSFVISKILDRKTVPVNIITADVEQSLFQLMKNDILSKVQRQAKRVCENPSCRARTWNKDMCPNCGRNLKIDGDYVEVKTNPEGIYNFVYKTISKIPDLKVSKDVIQIARRKFSVIDIMNNAGETLTIYIAPYTVPDEIINHYHTNGLPLEVILTHYRDAIHHRITEMNFECSGLVDLYITSANIPKLSKHFKNAVSNQKLRWKEKLLEKGFASYSSTRSKADHYTPQNYETDTFNMLHEIFYVAYKLGGTFTGVKAPDGILSVHDYSNPMHRFCLSWDCKYSARKNGYALNDNPKKHRHYIKILEKNNRVKFYGGLKIHAIISQNMNMMNYEKFYKKLVKKFSWRGTIIFIEEKFLLQLYRYYRENSQIILSRPNAFYACLYRMLFKIQTRDKIPYPILSETRLNSFFDEVETKFKKLNRTLEFTRKDFD